MDAPVQPTDESEQTITIVFLSASYRFPRATETNFTDAPVQPTDESEQTLAIVFPSASYRFPRATEQTSWTSKVRQETGFGQPSELVV